MTPGPVTVPPEQRGLVVALAALTLERSAPEELAVLPQLRTLLDEAQTFRVDGPEVARINGHLVWSLRAEVAALESQAAALGTGMCTPSRPPGRPTSSRRRSIGPGRRCSASHSDGQSHPLYPLVAARVPRVWTNAVHFARLSVALTCRGQLS
ncbi:MAG TPA: hypothetical protein VMT69_03025 [Kineosporiaceae bacterium]|nr:hypothetical protein [Kineosporiaceae bacterium]